MSRSIWTSLMLYFLLNCYVNSAYAQRRIVGGNETTLTLKRYMVYFVLAEDSPRNYDTWICGGAIIHPHYVLTSAACIEDVEKAFIVAGYNKYVKLADIDKDECIKRTKRRAIFTFVPVEYNLSYGELDSWTRLDIAVVKVDKPYKFNEADFENYCSYQPNEISVNFDTIKERPGIHVMALGWGSRKKWRLEGDKADLNEEKLRFVSSVISLKSICKNYFTESNLTEIIDQYMICTLARSTLKENGDDIEKLNSDSVIPISTSFQNRTKASGTGNTTITHGICQNDHGGPLVTWINKTETVIGVSSLFRVNENSECVSPNLFTSTSLNQQLLDCVVQNKINRRSSNCEYRLSNKLYKVVRRQISWEEHNKSKQDKKIRLRPQISLNYYKG